MGEPKPISDLLASWNAESQALTAIVPLVYDELRALAHRYLRKQRPEHTLQSTALVHEAYLRLKKQKDLHFEHPNQSSSDLRLISSGAPHEPTSPASNLARASARTLVLCLALVSMQYGGAIQTLRCAAPRSFSLRPATETQAL